MQAQEGDQIAIIVSQTLGFFVEEYCPKNVAFPILQNTYSLWRRYSYKKVEELSIFKEHQSQSKFKFYLLSQCHYLKKYIQKVINHLTNRQMSSQFSTSVPQSIKIDSQVMLKYNHALQIHTLHQELLEDITNLPYLDDIFSPQKKYQLKEEYSPEVVGFKDKAQIKDTVQNSLVNKGFGIIAEKVFTKTFILQASSLAIRLNPLSMVASYAFSELITRYRNQKKGEVLCEKVCEALENTQKGAQNLKNLYQECIGLLGPAIRKPEEGQKVFLQKLWLVLVEDWLSIEKMEDDDGWQIVQLHDSNEVNTL